MAIEDRDGKRQIWHQALDPDDSEIKYNDFLLAKENFNLLVASKRKSSWLEFASTLSYSSSASKTAKVIKEIGREQRSSPNIVLLSTSGKILDTDAKKARAFRGVYASVSSNQKVLANSRSHKAKTRRMKETVKNHLREFSVSAQCSPFSMVELRFALDQLQCRKASPDDIHNEMLLNLEDDLLHELLHILNLSWESGVVPNDWLQGLIIPVHKAGKDKTQLESYRPVCLMSVVAKLMEKLVCTRLRHELESRNLLDSCQSGFRKNRCTVDPLMELVNDIKEGDDIKHPTLLAAADLSRALDKVNHGKLLHEFHLLGLPSCFGKWYRAFLTDRRYKVKWGSTISRSCRFATGVPQGSVSGPLLFIIYMNSLAKKVSEVNDQRLKFKFFADDSSLWCVDKNVEVAASVVQKGLNVISSWSAEYGMPISVGKNESILFSSCKKDYSLAPLLHIGDDIIEYKDEIKILGVVIDKKLSFECHLKKMRKSTLNKLFQFRAIAGPCFGQSAQELRSLYVSYIRSGIEYGASIWSPFMCSSRINKLEVLQNQALRTITGCVRSTPIESLLQESYLVSLSTQFKIQTALYAEKYRRMPRDEPLYKLASKVVRTRRLKSSSWQHDSDETLSVLKLNIVRSSVNLYDTECRNFNSAMVMEKFGLLIDPRNREVFETFLPFSPCEVKCIEGAIVFNANTVSSTLSSDPEPVKFKANMDTLSRLKDFDFEL